MRSTFRNLRLSRFPNALGLCQDNIPGISSAAMEVQERLVNDGGEWGWANGWARVAFATASQVNPYLTLPPQFSRAIGFDVCRIPIRIQNPFYEVLDAGIGLRGPNNCIDRCGPMEAYDRDNFPTMVDLAGQNQYLRVYITDPTDAGKSVVITNAFDQNGNGIYEQNGTSTINGFVMVLEYPFVTSSDFNGNPLIVSSFGGVQKDATNGDVILKQVDASSGVEVELSRYTPDEVNPSYRRYYFSALPRSCCPPVTPANLATPITITALCKYNPLPVSRDTDWLAVNLSAMIEEAQSIFYGDMETPQAMNLSVRHHQKAIKLLNDELRSQLGESLPAINYAPFGTARLERAGIGTLI